MKLRVKAVSVLECLVNVEWDASWWIKLRRTCSFEAVCTAGAMCCSLYMLHGCMSIERTQAVRRTKNVLH